MVLCAAHYAGIIMTLDDGVACASCSARLAFITRDLATGAELEYLR